MFKATVHISEGTGAGYGLPAHCYIGGIGVAFSKSPKKALAYATDLAYRNKAKDAKSQGLPDGLIPIWDETILEKDGKVISHRV